MTRHIEFENGLRLVHATMRDIRSVAIGIWVGAGAVYETDENDGISHFTEHMFFKGTKKRSALNIAQTLDNIGAQVNAFTAKEYTCYYTKCVDNDVEICFDLLSDIYYNSTFPQDEIERERNVVLEEINMTQDSPEEVAGELLDFAMFGTQTYGRTILGPKENVKSFCHDDIKAYMSSRYVPKNTVISIAGNISFDSACKLVEKFFDTKSKGANANIITNAPRKFGQFESKKKTCEQTMICVGFPSLDYMDEDLYALQIGNAILGGGMSSRLFQEVRERLGLAYAVYSTFSPSATGGTFGMFCGTNIEKSELATNTMFNCAKLICSDGISEEEFLRGKAQIRGTFLFGQENVLTIMISLGRQMITTNRLISFAEVAKKIEAVEKGQVQNVLKRSLVTKNCCIATVGPKPSKSLAKLIK